MSPLSILRRAEADGVTVRLDADGKLRAFGPPAARAKWAPALRQRKVEILSAFKTANDPIKAANETDVGGLKKDETEQRGYDHFSFKTANSQSVAALKPDVQDRQAQKLGGLKQKCSVNHCPDEGNLRPPTVENDGGLKDGLAALNVHPAVVDDGPPPRLDWWLHPPRGWAEGKLVLRSILTGETSVIDLRKRRFDS